MQQDVEEVVAPGFESGYGVVEAEGEDTEGPVGLVGSGVGERGAPKVVEKELVDGGAWEEILVGLDGTAGRTQKLVVRQRVRDRATSEIVFVARK